jgi:hypothetical protein
MYDGLVTNSSAHTAATIPCNRSRAIATAAFEFLFQHFAVRKFSEVFNDADATKREVGATDSQRHSFSEINFPVR